MTPRVYNENDFKQGDRIIIGTTPGHQCNVVSSGRSGSELVLIIECEEGRGDSVYPNWEPVRHAKDE